MIPTSVTLTNMKAKTTTIITRIIPPTKRIFLTLIAPPKGKGSNGS